MRPSKQSSQTSKRTASRSYTGSESNIKFSLEVVQSPQRARTCGFGSKDRRPLQPAAVAKLHATRDGKAIDPEEVDTTFFVAMAELWSQDCTTNMTMVADPTLPVAHRGTRGPFPEPAAENPQSSVVLSNPGHPYDQAALMGSYPGSLPQSQQMPVYTPDATAPFVMAAPSYPSLAPTDPSLNPQGSFYPVLGYSTLLGTTQTGFYDPSSANSSSAQVQSDFYAQGPGLMGSSFGGLGLGQFLDMMICPLKPIHIVDPVTYTGMPGPSRASQGSPMPSHSGSGGSLTSVTQGRSPPRGSRRGSPPDSSSPGLEVQNLLGPTVANAFKLYDDRDRLGNFFIFQDLSVRTEGHFRLKIKLLCVAAVGAYGVTQQQSAILHEAWSGVFRVDPPKKFDGVPESTPLSDAFHRQGVKISTRKQKGVSSRKRGRGAGYASDDDDDDEDDED